MVMHWRSTPLIVIHDLGRIAQLMVIFLSQLDNTILTVKLFSDFFVGTHELVNLSRKLVVLVAHDPDMIVHTVDLNLQIRVTLNQ